MRSIYLWAMRNGSPILFAVAAILFLVGFGQALIGMRNTVGDGIIAGESLGQAGMQWIMFLSGTLAAFGSAAIPFFGALVIHRWDRTAHRARTETDSPEGRLRT